MSDIERDLISKILHEGDLSAVSDGGVTPAFFPTHDHREAFKSILEHQRDYAQVPSIEAFKRNYPAYRMSVAIDSMRYYVDELTFEYKALLLEDGLVEIVDLFESQDFEGAKNAMAKCLTQVNQEVTPTRAVDITENGAKRIERYKAYALNNGALKGISTGFSLLDAATGGMQPGQLFTFVGPPKAGKSTMMLLSMIFAHMGFYRPLFIGFEMSNEEQEERHDAIRAEISHKALRDGKLDGDDFRALEKMSRRLESMPPAIFSADSNGSTLSGIDALIDKYKPDVVYVDGVYMMDDENGEPKNSSQALTNITRGFKKMAQNRQLPIAISTQVLAWKMDRKRGVTTASIGYASSFGQDSDVLIGVEPTDDPNINKIKILDGRNVKRMEIYVMWDWETGTFTEMEREEEEVEDPDAPAKF